MDELFRKSENLVKKHAKYAKRGIYDQIIWDSKLIGIKGARGIGKTTLLLQRLFDLNLSSSQAVYISLDDWYFTNHTLLSFAEDFVKIGGKYLFIDEVHKYSAWSIQIKNLYDFYDLNIVFTGSSILDIAKLEGDLSRRVVMYTMQGLSFREFLQIEYNLQLPKMNFYELLNHNSQHLESLFPENFNPFLYFNEYLKIGYYPIFKEGKSVFRQKIQQIIRQIIEYDMAELRGFDIRNAKKMLQLLGVISQNVPFKPNIQKLAEKMDLNRITLNNYLIFLAEAQLINLLYSEGNSTSVLQKPEKIYFDNTNLAFALSGDHAQNLGNLRETFVLNQLKQLHQVHQAKDGDFVIDGKFTIEIGGKNKSSSQIRNVPNSFRVLDDITFTNQEKVIPLWLIGFLY